MKHAGTRRENTVPNFAYRETTLGRNIGKAFAIRDTSALYIRGVYVFTLFLVKKFDDSLTKKKKRQEKIVGLKSIARELNAVVRDIYK